MWFKIAAIILISIHVFSFIFVAYKVFGNRLVKFSFVRKFESFFCALRILKPNTSLYAIALSQNYGIINKIKSFRYWLTNPFRAVFIFRVVFNTFFFFARTRINPFMCASLDLYIIAIVILLIVVLILYIFRIVFIYLYNLYEVYTEVELVRVRSAGKEPFHSIDGRFVGFYKKEEIAAMGPDYEILIGDDIYRSNKIRQKYSHFDDYWDDTPFDIFSMRVKLPIDISKVTFSEENLDKLESSSIHFDRNSYNFILDFFKDTPEVSQELLENLIFINAAARRCPLADM